MGAVWFSSFNSPKEQLLSFFYVHPLVSKNVDATSHSKGFPKVSALNGMSQRDLSFTYAHMKFLTVATEGMWESLWCLAWPMIIPFTDRRA